MRNFDDLILNPNIDRETLSSEQKGLVNINEVSKSKSTSRSNIKNFGLKQIGAVKTLSKSTSRSNIKN